jgi:ankyrin repeat protein
MPVPLPPRCGWLRTLLKGALLGFIAWALCPPQALHFASGPLRSPLLTAGLLQLGFSPGAEDWLGRPALSVAALQDSVVTAHQLLAAGAAVTQTDAMQRTALHAAAAANGARAITFLAAYVRTRGFSSAAGYVAGAGSCRTSGGAAASSDETDGHAADRPAAAAATAQQPCAVAALLHGADEDGRTPLHLAAQRSAGGAVRALLDAGAAVDAGDRLRQTPLHLAAASNAVGTAQQLLDAGAPFDALDAAGASPLHLAASADAVAAVSLLLRRGADVLLRDEAGSPPLHRAAAANAAGAVAALLAEGCPPRLVDDAGVSALEVAQRHGATDAAAVLQRALRPP